MHPKTYEKFIHNLSNLTDKPSNKQTKENTTSLSRGNKMPLYCADWEWLQYKNRSM